MTVRDWYENAIKYGEPLLRDIILILVVKRGILKWDDDESKLRKCLNPTPEKADAVNRFFKLELEQLRKGRRTA